MAIMLIGGVEIPPPKSIDIQYTRIGKTETNAAGDTIMDLLAVKRKLSITWAHLNPEQAADVVTAVNAGPFVDVTVIDPETGETETGEYRCTKEALSSMRYESDAPIGYRDIEIDLTER